MATCTGSALPCHWGGVVRGHAARLSATPLPLATVAGVDAAPGTGWARLPDHLGLSVQAGQVPSELSGARRPLPWAQVSDTAAMLRFRHDGRLLVERGERVTIDWAGADALGGDPRWILQGWAVTLAWLQRGHLSVHAATARIGDAVVALAGHRGAGKSTTTMGLQSRGHTVLVDDVALVETRGGTAWTTPYARNVHLLPDSARALGLDYDALPRLAGGRDKVAVTTASAEMQTRRLDMVVVLDVDDDPLSDAPRLERVRGAQCLRLLAPHTARDGLAPEILGRQRYFELLAELADTVPVYSLRRPQHPWSLPAVLDLVETVAREHEALPGSHG